MPIKKLEVSKNTETKKQSMTFRLSMSAAIQLKKLAEYSGQTKTWVIEELLRDETGRKEKEDPAYFGKSKGVQKPKSQK